MLRCRDLNCVRRQLLAQVGTALGALLHCSLVVVACALATAAAAGAAPERVEFPSGEVTINGRLWRPAGDGPFPAVVALHDCGGLRHRPNAEPQLFNQWANLLVDKGFVVLFPDSFGSRGLGSQCGERDRKVKARRERVGDANAARRFLQAQKFVRPDRISLLGWSNGGAAVLWAVRPTAAPKDGADFRSAVAIYPGCRLSRETAWSARIPTLILIGSADDWTPASYCQQMVAGAHGRSAGAELVVYPGAHHDFDRANAPLRLRTGLANTPDPAGRAHGGTDPAARSDALKRVPAWLGR